MYTKGLTRPQGSCRKRHSFGEQANERKAEKMSETRAERRVRIVAAEFGPIENAGERANQR
jgi:hypothetical protein